MGCTASAHPGELSIPLCLCSWSEHSRTHALCVTVRRTQLLETSSIGFSPSTFLQTYYLHLGLACSTAQISSPLVGNKIAVISLMSD